jgi:tetratricopeptide (TPR) repeat protein
MCSMFLRRLIVPFLGICFLFVPSAWAQRNSASSLTLLEVEVQVRYPDGRPGPEGIHVLLEAGEGGMDADCQTREGGTCKIRPSNTGVFQVVLDNGQYLPDSQRVELIGITHGYVTLTLRPSRPEPTSNAAAVNVNGGPILAPKAQRELTHGLQELAAAKPDEARKHFQAAAKIAPNNPDVNYLLGLLAAQARDRAQARAYWEKAISFYPRHALSLTALGETYLTEQKLPDARRLLERAVEADNNSWRAQQLLAMVLVKQHAYEESAQHALRALEVGKYDANAAHLVLAEAYLGSGRRDDAIKTLQEMLARTLNHEQVSTAQRFLDELSRNSVTASIPPGAVADEKFALVSNTLPLPSVRQETLMPSAALPKWFPANVDDSVPPVAQGTACPIDQIRDQAGRRVQELVHSVDRFTATETLDHESLNQYGLTTRRERRTFEYLVSIQEVNPGELDVEEYRDATTALDVFPENIATLGMASLVLVFHPNYVGDYDLRCEGLAEQAGTTAWQVHFRQNPNRPGRLRSYRLGNRYYRVGLKGRAWIASDTFQIVRMEADLDKQVPDLRLFVDHQTVQYGPVPFEKKHVTLWLPSNTDLYLDYNGHRLHRQHTFTNYMLFSVDEQQQIRAPTQAEQQ